jgi:hypothetical protein
MSGMEPFGSKSANVVILVYFYSTLSNINPPIKVYARTTPFV